MNRFVYFIEGVEMKKTVLNTMLSTALIVALGVSVSACGGDEEHEVLAKDRVDEAAELARANAPAAEDMAFPETAPMAADDATGMDTGDTATAAAETADAGMTDAGMTDSAEAMATDSADEPAAQ